MSAVLRFTWQQLWGLFWVVSSSGSYLSAVLVLLVSCSVSYFSAFLDLACQRFWALLVSGSGSYLSIVQGLICKQFLFLTCQYFWGLLVIVSSSGSYLSTILDLTWQQLFFWLFYTIGSGLSAHWVLPAALRLNCPQFLVSGSYSWLNSS